MSSSRCARPGAARAGRSCRSNYRRILELRFLQAFSVREAAGQMGVSVANAKVLQHRALQMAAQNEEEAL